MTAQTTAPLAALKALVALTDEAPEDEIGPARFTREAVRMRAGLDVDELDYALQWLTADNFGTREPFAKVSRVDGGVWLTARGADAYGILEAFGAL